MNPIVTEMQKDKRWKAYIAGNPDVCEYGEKETIAVSKLLLRLQGVRVVALNGATLFAGVMWVCWLKLSWMLMVMGLQMNAFNGMMWGLFLLLAIFGNAYAARK